MKVSLEPSHVQAEQPQFSQPVFTGEVLQPPSAVWPGRTQTPCSSERLWKWSFFHDTHSALPLSGSGGYKRENCMLYLLDPASFSHPTHAYGRAQKRGFTPLRWTLMIYCHDNSPLSRGLGEPCELVSPEYIFPAVEDGCQTFAEQKGMLGMPGSHQMLWRLANPLSLTLCCAIACQNGLQAEQAGQQTCPI